MLLGSGAAALAWWRFREAPRPETDVLHDAYRLFSLQAAVHEDEVAQAVSCLREAGAEPILAKGWAIARFYPEPGLRPYGDIDLSVPSARYEDARRALATGPTAAMNIDLQAGFPDLADRRWEDLYGRSQRLPLAATEVAVLGSEDHLRLLCLHFLRHGAWRPLWLCDIGAFVEALPAAFDWDLCLRGDRGRAGGVVWVLTLARALLGASLDAAPAAVQETEPAPWFPAAALRRWEIESPPFFKLTTTQALRRPDRLFHGLRERWPDPVTATAELRGPWNRWPRLPFQSAAFARQIAGWAGRVGRRRSDSN